MKQCNRCGTFLSRKEEQKKGDFYYCKDENKCIQAKPIKSLEEDQDGKKGDNFCEKCDYHIDLYKEDYHYDKEDNILCDKCFYQKIDQKLEQ